MKKFFSLAMVMFLIFSSFLTGCGGGGGGGSTSPDDGTPVINVPEFTIETEDGDIINVPAGVVGTVIKVIIKKTDTNTLVYGETVRLYIPSLNYERTAITDYLGACYLTIPRIDFTEDVLAELSLPNHPEIDSREVILRYVVDPTIPKGIRLTGGNYQETEGGVFEIGLSFGESTVIFFEVVNFFDQPLSGIKVDVILGGSGTAYTDASGIVAFPFTAGTTSASTLFRVYLPDYSDTVYKAAEVWVYWQDDSSSGNIPANIYLPNSYIGADGVRTVDVPIDTNYPLLVQVTDTSDNSVQGVMVKILYPAGEYAITDGDGIATIVIPASPYVGYDHDEVWVTISIGEEIRLVFKIVYFVPVS